MVSKSYKLIAAVMIVILLATTVTASFAAPAIQAEQDIVDTAVAAGNFTTLAQLLTDAGLVETLKGEGPFTVFAPTDEAFAAVPADTLAALAANPDELVRVLTYHVVPGQVMAADVVNLTSADTVAGLPLSISVTDGTVMVDGATVTATDIEASNGVIHVIDAVMLPPAEGEMEDGEMMEEPMAEMDIVDTAVAAGNFTTLAQLLTDAGLVETLKGEGPFTVFAPTDEAFAAVPADTLAALAANTDELVKVLTYHVVPGQVMAADVVNLTSADTVAGLPLSISVTDGTVMVDGATVTATDIEASNGVIHVIDAVMLPPAEEAMAEGEMMADEAMGESVASCEDYTVQADDWLSRIAERFLGDVLAYPQLVDATNAAAAQSSKYATIANADVIEVGQVICVPTGETAMAEGEGEAMAASEGEAMASSEGEAMAEGEGETMAEPMAEMDIVDTAVAAGNFTTLAQLLTDAGLVETLKGEGPFTVFAPTDEAFAAVPADTLAALAANTDELVKVLTYHVVPGQVMAADVVNLTSADTVAGLPLSISVTDGTVMVDGATVTATDIEASNGVIHVIDAVMLPPSE